MQVKTKPYIKREKPTIFYIAYGSNLNKESMKFRCQDAVPVCATMLNNAKLVFRGVADISYEPGSRAPAALWKISKFDERVLDHFEGVGHGMYRKKWINIGKNRQALIYLMNDDGVHPPSKYYCDVIRKGYRDFGLDESYLNEAVAASFEKRPTEQTQKRREQQKLSKYQAKLVELPESVALEKIELMQKRLANSENLD